MLKLRPALERPLHCCHWYGLRHIGLIELTSMYSSVPVAALALVVEAAALQIKRGACKIKGRGQAGWMDFEQQKHVPC